MEEKEIPLLQRIERQALEEGREWAKNRIKELIEAEEAKERRQSGGKKKNLQENDPS